MYVSPWNIVERTYWSEVIAAQWAVFQLWRCGHLNSANQTGFSPESNWPREVSRLVPGCVDLTVTSKVSNTTASFLPVHNMCISQKGLWLKKNHLGKVACQASRCMLRPFSQLHIAGKVLFKWCFDSTGLTIIVLGCI